MRNKIEMEFREMRSLTLEEKQSLRELAHPPDKRSLFRQWLDHPEPMPDYYWAAILKINGEIRGWAAVCAGYSRYVRSEGLIGVFIHPDYRGRGLARQTLDFLLANFVAAGTEDPPEYLIYDEGKERVFRDLILKHGFKDIWKTAI
jgi:GNAT superfamily N-acetyltransferase